MEILKNSNHDEIKDGFLSIISAIEAANGGSHDEHYILDKLLSGLKKILIYDIHIEASYSRKSYSLLPCEIVADINILLADEIQLDDYEKSCISSDELYLDENMRKTKNSITATTEIMKHDSYIANIAIYSKVGEFVGFRASCKYPNYMFGVIPRGITVSTKGNGASLPTNRYAHIWHYRTQKPIRKRDSEYNNDTNGKFAPISKEAFFELLVWLTETQY